MNKRLIVTFAMLLLLTLACSTGNNAAPGNTVSDQPINEVDNAAADEVVEEPTPTPEPTQPPANQEELSVRWKPAIGLETIILASCQGTLEIAEGIQAEEMSGFEGGLALLVQAALLNAAVESYDAWTPEDGLDEVHDIIGEDLGGMKSVLAAWYNEEISSADVVPLLNGADGCAEVEANMAAIAERAGDEGMTEETFTSILDELAEALEEIVETEEVEESESSPVVEVVDVAWYSSYDSFYFIGTVQNTGDVPVHFTEIHVTFRDAAGTMVDSESSYSSLDVINPGEVSPFKVILFDAGGFEDAWTDYEIHIEADEYDWNDNYKEFEILSHTGEVDNYGYYEIIGEIKNIGSETADWVEIIGVFYDAEGNLVGMESTYSEFDEIAPDGTSPFTIWFSTDDLPGEVDHYELAVEGDIAD